MPKEKKDPIVLTEEQKAVVEKNWHLDLRTLTQLVFNNPSITLRHIESRAVKEHLATLGKEVVEQQTEGKEALISELTEEHQVYIRANYLDSTPLEMARILFNNKVLLPSAREALMVQAYCRKIDPNYRRDDDMVDDIDYQPPKSIIALASRINKYGVASQGDGPSLFANGQFTGLQRKQLEALLSYMRLPIFRVEANTFIKKIDREVFESTFIGTCWDKPDLPHEHVLQFIQLASLTVKYKQTDRVVQKLDERLSATLEDPLGRLNMAEVETLNAVREKTTAISKQISALIKTLTGERAKQLNEKIAGAGSMHPLVQAWKQKETRDKIIAMVKRTKQDPLKQEIERLSTMDALKAEIWGINPETIVH